MTVVASTPPVSASAMTVVASTPPVSVSATAAVATTPPPTAATANTTRPTLVVSSPGPFPPAVAEGLTTEIDVPFTDTLDCAGRDCTLPLDVLAPSTGTGLPTIVLVPGGPAPFDTRRYLDALAGALARGGAVVFLTSYRSAATGNSRVDTMHDVWCAVRFARAVTADYGGDPDQTVLVGHSLAGDLALTAAIEPDTDTPGCLHDGNATPDAVVGLAPDYAVTIPGSLDPTPPVMLASGSNDPGSTRGADVTQQLLDAGRVAEYREFADTTHEQLIDPAATPGVVDLVFEVINQTNGA
jgi:acetyl esterase/lipase